MTRPALAAAMRAQGARTQPHDIRFYEDDTYDPKLRAFAVLARVFGMSMEALLYGEEVAAPASASPSAATSAA